ncbi:MAG: PEP-CTERM sorting domain-containing protein [Acidobacteriota bacterium]
MIPVSMKVRMRRGVLAKGLGAVVLWAASGAAAHAGPILFTFDPTTSNPLADGGSSAAITNYMNNLLFNTWGTGYTVTVGGAKAETNNSYTGDRHVVGPVTNGSVTSLTLGNSDYASSQGTVLGTVSGRSGDGYIYNSNTTMFWMDFSFPISQISFDFEIFPNALCGNPKDAGTPTSPGAGGGNCSVWPDFTLMAGVPGAMTTYFFAVSQDPAEPGYVGYKYSPFSGTGTKEKAPQLLATSGVITFPTPVMRLEFYDWPERVGIDNLQITPPPPVPEPSALLLTGSGLALLLSRRRASRRARARGHARD